MNISVYDTSVRSGKNSLGLAETEIEGKTIGIIGCGQIGLKTAKLFLAFGAKVLAYARHEREEAKELGIEYVDLDTLLTSHVAFLTRESMVRRARTEFDNVYTYLDGKTANVCRY